MNVVPPQPISPDVVAHHGLSPEEYERIVHILGHEPNIVELGIFSVMWSEHCSYKSSKKWLKTLPTTASWVLHGPGENAGVIDIGQDQAVVFKIESHNHPSFLEPFQGAATGVGGILRDVFTMGARPVALLNALRFGDPSHPKTRHLLAGVVAGIGHYGNCVGVPTVGGEVNFHPSYNGNILVNAMAVGVAPKDRLFCSAAAGVGNAVIYVGSKTGRDGIHGATMASADFDEGADDQRPTVQVGDPFTEKCLIEACLELMSTDAIVAIQDMGAAGLTSSSFEMASKGGMGITLYLDRVPACEADMTPYELMLSESQERMLMVVAPGKEGVARSIFAKWDLECVVVGTLTDTGRMSLIWHGDVVGDLPVDPLAQASPEYDRPWAATPPSPEVQAADVLEQPWIDVLPRLLACPDVASRRWIWQQYDHMVMGDTVVRPGHDAAVVRLHGTDRALALTVDCTPRYVRADPVEGGRQAVVETWRNIIASGGWPLAVTDNLNFGNPERPDVMGQLVGACQGISDACRTLDYPVVSGNVSLYNETNGRAILPTPVIGGVGIIDDVTRVATLSFVAPECPVILIGQGERRGWLGQSLYMREMLGQEDGAPPPVDLSHERHVGTFVHGLIAEDLTRTAHDLSDGGLLVAAAEMALASDMGMDLHVDFHGPLHAALFGEDQGRYLIVAETDDVARMILARASGLGISARVIGKTGGESLSVNGVTGPTVSELKARHEGWLPTYMEEGSSPKESFDKKGDKQIENDNTGTDTDGDGCA